MSAGSKKSVTRRELIALTGGALGAAALAGRAVANTLSPAGQANTIAAGGAQSAEEAARQASAAAMNDAQGSLPAGAWVAPPAQASGPQHKAQQIPLASESTLAAFGGLQSGSVVDRWTIESIHEVHLGGVPVVLRDAHGNRFQVDVLARDAGVRGVAETSALSFFVVNAGNGSVATAEEQGLAAMTLAAVVGRRGATAVPAGLLSLTQRQTRFADGDFRLLA